MRRPAAFIVPGFRPGAVRLTPPQTGLLAGSLALAIACSWLVIARNGSRPESAAAPLLPPLSALAAPSRPVSPYQYSSIVGRNPFARSRQAPAEPWAPIATGAEGEAVAGPASEPGAGDLRLYGTVEAGSPERSVALIEADPSRPGPELYRVGDGVATYRLRAIYRARVILAGPGGNVELYLAPDTTRGGKP